MSSMELRAAARISAEVSSAILRGEKDETDLLAMLLGDGKNPLTTTAEPSRPANNGTIMIKPLSPRIAYNSTRNNALAAIKGG